ncbi:putative mfs multidrug transporter protein [Botrytis fragariae]|uniref:Putative mfs multidrug transporter protein n=1 Tax=Botrytis fragariae TaxID=1964551 RepID=A0A8H6EJ36_9HELO|nr:putative mfs multidrug transporter protein [Botrytis fragariae]KAF5874111.1 putative mfs multidrug transporter protein [Botrytis fragariae]
MSLPQDLEKGILAEEEHEQEHEQEHEIGTKTESTAYQSDNSRNPSPKNDGSANASIADRDSNLEAVKTMDEGHIDDLERQKTTTESIKVGPSSHRAHPNSDSNDKTSTNSKSSSGSRLARIAHRSHTPRAKLPPRPIPVSNLANGIVGWESQTDPEMPLNFPETKKWMLTGLLASITFISPLASSMFAPGVTFADKEFHNSSLILSSFTVSIFVLGYVVGPLILAPLSEMYGRRYVLTGGNIIFCVWQIGCALAPSLSTLIGFRFMAGLGGSGCLTIGAGMIADLFHADRRGLATSLFSLGPLFGPVIGPIAGGFVAQRIGWRWVFWILFIAGTIITIGIECLNVETNPRLLIKRKVARLSKELNRSDLRSVYDPSNSAHHSNASVLANAMIRPLKMLIFSPIVFILSLYMAVVYGLLYLLFTTITTVFTDKYHWAPELGGLAYIGLGFGFFLGLVVVARISDVTVVRMTKANNGIFEPEMRLPACIFFACFIPISFFWYGWSIQAGVHWIVPIIGLIPFGFGMMGIFIPIQTYVIDSFPSFAASGIAALTVSRSLFGAFLPLAGPAMYAKLGYGWGNSVLGFIALALIPAPMIIYKFGGRVRKRFPVKL